MFFPIRTDRRLNTTPWVNYALITANVLLFVWLQHDIVGATNLIIELQRGATNFNFDSVLRDYPVISYYLRPEDPQLFQFVTYAFLHASPMHLIGNMIFLFIFGNGVEDRLGKTGYLLFYLSGAVLAGLGHLGSSSAPVLGASGAVAAVTGAYLALFPLSNVTIVYWFIVIGAFEVSSIVLILFRVGQDVVFHFLDIGNTAYVAHLAGYLFGFAMGMALLFARLLAREPYDMLALIEQKRRRSQFQKMTRDGYAPWQGKAGKDDTPAQAKPDSPEAKALMERRSKISAAIADHDLPEAARRYVQLIEDHPEQVMAQQQQLDLANQLMSAGWYDKAAIAYELFLTTYHAYAQKHQIQLILGLIYARYLEQPDRAKELLTAALPKLDGEEKQLAETELAGIG